MLLCFQLTNCLLRLWPFCTCGLYSLYNAELLIRYKEVMQGEDHERKDHLKESFENLEHIANDETIIHEDTKFHCYGSSMKTTDYDEDEWTVQLYHSIKNNTPVSISVIPSYQYKAKLPALLEKLSTSRISAFFLKGVPDFVFIKKGTASSSDVGTASSDVSSVHVYTEDLNLVEIKQPGHLTMPRQSSATVPHAFGQMRWVDFIF